MQQTAQRPTGITILAVLAAIGGVFDILGGLAWLGLTSISSFAPIMGILYLLVGVASLGFAYGAWSLQPWAWMVGIGVQAGSVLIGIVALILGLSNIGSLIVGIIIAGIIVYYLMTPPIKKAFGQPA